MDITTVFGTVVPGSSPGGSTMKTNRKALLAAAKKHGTPLYLYDRAIIECRCRDLRNAFPGVVIHYAMKANSNPEVLAVIRKQGIGIEAVSGGELRRAKAAGFPKDDISFTCSNVAPEELSFAAKHAGRVYLDSLHQIESWGRLRLGKEVSLRINQGIGGGHHAHVITGGPDSKFGIDRKDFAEARRLADRYDLRIAGLMQHIGSNVLDAGLYLRAARKLIDATKDFPDAVHLDFGGGLGVPYSPEERRLDIAALGKDLAKEIRSFRAKRPSSSFAMEPGRYLVAEAGMLLVTVTDIKSTAKHTFIGVDSGFNHLIRPAMYGSYHPIENLSRSRAKRVPVTVAGNICESGDLFAVKRPMPMPQIGDMLAIGLAGAYGYSMASNYNLRELPPEILI